MFDFDAGKLLIIGVIALIVIGPKELPRVLRQVGQTVGRLRRMASEFQGQFMDAMKEADLQSIKEEMDKINRESVLSVDFDPAREIQSELTRSIGGAVPEGTPAMAAVPSAPMTDFTLPAPDPEPTTKGDIFAAAGHAPEIVAEAPLSPALGIQALPAPAPVAEAAVEVVPERSGEPRPELRVSRKRKIILPKRRPVRAPMPLDVSDRTRHGSAARLRLRAFEP